MTFASRKQNYTNQLHTYRTRERPQPAGFSTTRKDSGAELMVSSGVEAPEAWTTAPGGGGVSLCGTLYIALAPHF